MRPDYRSALVASAIGVISALIGIGPAGASGSADATTIVSFGYMGRNSAGEPASSTADPGITVETFVGGYLTVNSDGSWRYVPPASVDNRLGVSSERFTYMLRDADGDTAEGSRTIEIRDPGIEVTVSTEPVSLLEANLQEGSAPDAAKTRTSGSFADNFDFGPDGPGSVTKVRFGEEDHVPDANGRVALDAGTWRLEVEADGQYSLTLLQAVAHEEGTDSLELAPFEVTMSDGAGDDEAATKLFVTIQDDAPQIVPNEKVSVEEGGAKHSIGVNLLQNDLQGADGANLNSFSYTGRNASGNAVPMTADAGARVETYLGGTLTVHADGSWDYAPPTSVDNSAGAVSDSFDYVLMDTDQDRMDSRLANGTQIIEVTDVKIVVAHPGMETTSVSVSEAALVNGSAPDAGAVVASGSFADNFEFGPDGPGSVTKIGFGDEDHPPDADGRVMLDADTWRLAVEADGQYSFTLLQAVAHDGGADLLELPPFEVTMSDGTGDGEATTKLLVTIRDDVPMIVEGERLSVEEGGANGGISGNLLKKREAGQEGGDLDGNASLSSRPSSEISWLYVTGFRVNVRNGPTIHADRVTRFPRGTRVMPVEFSDEWTKVLEPKSRLSGWMHNRYLGTELDRSVPATTPKLLKDNAPYRAKKAIIAYVVGSSVNCRSGPSLDAEVVAIFRKDKALKTIGSRRGWSAVIDPESGIQGWIRGRLLRSADVQSVNDADASVEKKELSDQDKELSDQDMERLQVIIP